ncbi:MAG: hypothetical protein NWE89_11560 [Candidatus Bathyarchaeota archaeon]|nr:hypothetical protein [Candidatus Bathyarchaeota archaeon]
MVEKAISGAVLMNIIQDDGTVITHDLVKGHEYEVTVRAVGPDGVKQPMEDAARNTIVIEGKLDAPGDASNLVAVGGLSKIALSWTNPDDTDFDYMEIWRASVNTLNEASKIAEIRGTSYIDDIGSTGATRYYWIRARNTSGVIGSFYPETDTGVSGTTEGITVTSIDDFAVTATKFYTNTIVLTGDVWSNDTPDGSSIAWNGHYLVYGGAYYKIVASSTNKKYVYWAKPGAPSGSGTVADPYISFYTKNDLYAYVADVFMVATNISGIHQLVWNASANMVIGSAFILDAAIVNAKIGNLAVTEGKIGNLAVAEGKIKNLAVTNAKIANATIESAKIVSLDADKINVGTLTGFVIQTAAAGQRVVVTSADNTLRFYNAANVNVLTIDDAVFGATPGILITDDTNGGVVYIWQALTNFSYLNEHKLLIKSSTDDDRIDIMTGADASLFKIDKNGNAYVKGYVHLDGLLNADAGADIEGNVDIAGNLDVHTGVDVTGNITVTGTVDGIDLLAHASRHNSGQADAINLSTFEIWNLNDVEQPGAAEDNYVYAWNNSGHQFVLVPN